MKFELKDLNLSLKINGADVTLQELVEHYSAAHGAPAHAARAYATYVTNEKGAEEFHAALWHPCTTDGSNERKVSGYFIPDSRDHSKNSIDQLAFDIATRVNSVLNRHHLLLPNGTLKDIREVITQAASNDLLDV